jgi:hypothetical protein
MDRRPGGPHNRSGRYEEEENLPLPGIKPQPSVPIPTELSRLSPSSKVDLKLVNVHVSYAGPGAIKYYKVCQITNKIYLNPPVKQSLKLSILNQNENIDKL